MTDKFSQAKRSDIMSRVSGRDTLPERKVRSVLHRLGYRFRIHVHGLPGNPDIVLKRHKRIVFVHGCFWHGHKGCAKSKRPTTNVDFWNPKLDKNIKRDILVRKQLRELGWQVLVVWQCQTNDELKLRSKLLRFMTGRRST